MNRLLMSCAALAAIAALGTEAAAQTRVAPRQTTTTPAQTTAPAQVVLQGQNTAGNFSVITFPETTGDKISLFGNRISQPNMYGFGVASNTLTYRSASAHKWFVNEANANATPAMALLNGKLGIGVGNPDHELVVQGNDPAFQIRDDTTDNSANAARIELLERSGGNFGGGAYLWWNGQTDKLLIGMKENGNNTNLLVLDRATNSVGIGTQNPGAYKLAVNGKVRAKEIVVETGWSDYVFDEGYELKSLPEVKAFIEENGHLPDVPSAEEIAENGVSVGESQSMLLRKVEELTLHVIALEERIAELESGEVE